MKARNGKIRRLASILPLLWRYGVLAFLLAWCAVAVVAYLVAGDRPVPLSPPDGYVAEEARVSLSWSAGENPPEHEVEVAEGRDFSSPVFSKSVKGTATLLPRLEPGAEYCWRLASNPSKVSCFTTGRNSIAY